MLTVSFSHEASRFLFRQIANKIAQPFHEFFINFDLSGEKLKVSSFEGNLGMLDKTAFIPVDFSFGCGSFNHQGVLVIENNVIYCYEPYGTWKRNINGVLLDYFEPLCEYIGRPLKKAPFDLQTRIMEHQLKRYNEFYEKFKVTLGKLKKRDKRKYDELCDKLKKIDLTCETSKYVYLIEAISFCRNDEKTVNELIELYNEYSPYSCVSIVIVELCVFHALIHYDYLLAIYADPSNRSLNAALKKAISILCKRFDENFTGKTFKEVILLQDFFC